MQTNTNLKAKLTAVAVSATAAVGVAGIATGAEGNLASQLPAQSTLERAVVRHQAVRSYERVLADAKKLGVAPKLNAAKQVIPVPKLERKTAELRKDVRKAKREPDFGTPESLGVSRATLETIAACESGGDYTTNTGNGFSGAYQFMDSTWQGVGGSTASAYQATPEEQDYRAALLYSQSSSSPWPVCGV